MPKSSNENLIRKWVVFWPFCATTITMWFVVVVGFSPLSPLQYCTSASIFRAMCFFYLLDRSTQEILAQHASAAAQYDSTLHKLTQINTTVNFLLDVLEKTRHVGIRGHIHFVFVISFW